MWNLPLEKIESVLAEQGGLPSTVIETGTCRGHATRALARRFARVISIELSPSLAAEARARLAGPEFNHVELLQGDSAKLLPEVLRSLPAEAPVFFFLDAHWSGDRSVDWEKAIWKGYGIETAHLGVPGTSPSGPEQCPLLDELSAIVRWCKGPAEILIDDLKNLPASGAGLRDNEFPGEDWSHLSRELLLSVVKPRLRRAIELTDPAQWLLSLSPDPDPRPY